MSHRSSHVAKALKRESPMFFQSQAPITLAMALCIGAVSTLAATKTGASSAHGTASAAASASPSSAASTASSSSQSPAGEVLNQKKIHSDYNDGNFEKVITALEGFMSRNKTYTLKDSLFIVKHLAVVYSANPETREKGRYYMYQLLTIMPSAKLIDMYVSDEI